MRKIRVCVELEETMYHEYEGEAARRGVSVESLVEQTLQVLLGELQQEERDGTDHPIIPS